jgi:hypothetical protein
MRCSNQNAPMNVLLEKMVGASSWKGYGRAALPELCDLILEAVRRGTVTLVYSYHDGEHNNAAAMRNYLESRLGREHRRLCKNRRLEFL